jgi:hypothetical protein
MGAGRSRLRGDFRSCVGYRRIPVNDAPDCAIKFTSRFLPIAYTNSDTALKRVDPELEMPHPTPFIGRIKAAGCKIICQVQTLAG